MQTNKFSRSIGRFFAGAVAGVAFIGLVACVVLVGRSSIHETIIEGDRFAHYLELPSGFSHATTDAAGPPFDRYGFRLASADVLLVAACRDETSPSPPYSLEVCSQESYAIDTGHQYRVTKAAPGEWERASPVEGYMEMDAPYLRNLKQVSALPAFSKPVLIGPPTKVGGYKFRGKDYLPRSGWITGLNFGSSPDGQLVMLAGYDRKRAYRDGVFTIDIFASEPENRVAALDVNYRVGFGTSVDNLLRQVSLVNSRWIVLGLDYPRLRKSLMFDFGSQAPAFVR